MLKVSPSALDFRACRGFICVLFCNFADRIHQKQRNMNRKTIITILLAIIALMGQAQEARIDTIVTKFLINGYFFREMPKLPDATPSMTRLKVKDAVVVDKKGIVRHAVHGTSEDKRAELLAKIKEADAE